ncbi:DUF1868 domain-containing protein [Terriglobus albidus]|uniref:DUF1868 domain-containing protein n=1 Tax=Terriglobus albidus TaxID=1592106 RepID=UPI00164D32F2|nr:DUF1868 domain-containing protein [Terriglobus albidus]
MTTHTRRQFLLESSAAVAASLLPSSLFAQPAAAETPKIPNRDTTLKFNPDGTPRPFAGNTVICHLPVQSAMRDAMATLHQELKRASYHTKLGLTSTDSYHMTIFPGANDLDRSAYGWPSYVPSDAPIEVCTRMVGERIAKKQFACQLPLRVRVDQEYTINYPMACSLRLVGADAEEGRKLRSLRDQLAEVFGFRLRDHAEYQFHMTMSYQMVPFTAEERSAYRDLMRVHIKRIAEAVPVLELGIPEFCSFPDMFRFEPQHLLVCS